MKHLKIYENYSEFTELKKYLIFKFPSNIVLCEQYYIYKDSKTFDMKRLYILGEYDKSPRCLTKEFKNQNYDEIKSKIVYQTDDLKDALEMMPVCFNIQEYNL